MGTDRPLAITPAIVSKFKKQKPGSVDFEPDPILDALEAALTAAKAKADQIASIEEAVTADATITAAARATKIRDAALRLGEQAAGSIDAAKQRIAAELETIGNATSQPPPPKDALQMQIEAEIRGRLAVMAPAERKEALGKAEKDCDETMLAAVLRGPAMLAGMGPAEQQMTRATWRRAKFPDEIDREARLARALEAAERAGRALVAYVQKIADADAAAKSDAAAKKAAEALAAAE